jgi:hypothetical protein
MQMAGIISKQSRGENIDEPALYIIPNYVRLPQPPLRGTTMHNAGLGFGIY